MADDLGSLIAGLRSSDAHQQIGAAEALARLGERARPAAVALVCCLDRVDGAAREWCVATLEGIGSAPADQLDELIDMARDESSDRAYWAITLLGRAGTAANAGVATLVDVLNDSTELAVRERAAWALGKIGPAASSARPALRRAAESGPPRLRRLAMAALESIDIAS